MAGDVFGEESRTTRFRAFLLFVVNTYPKEMDLIKLVFCY